MFLKEVAKLHEKMHIFIHLISVLENLQQLLLWTPPASCRFIHFQTPDEPQSQTKVQENMAITGNRRVELKPAAG